MNDWFENGAQAEYCVAPASALAPEPKSIDHAQAAVVPISALTAWQGLFEHARLKAGERVLIHGAAGGVGVFAVQLAHWRGAHVIGTASAENVEFVRQLGADEVIDYRATPFETAAREMDVVFDTVGGATLERSWGVLKPGGLLVTIATQSETSADPRVRQAFFIVEPNRGQLTEIARLIDGRQLRPIVAAVFWLPRRERAVPGCARRNRRVAICLANRQESFTSSVLNSGAAMDSEQRTRIVARGRRRAPCQRGRLVLRWSSQGPDTRSFQLISGQQHLAETDWEAAHAD